MMLAGASRKTALTAHVLVSVGWVGAVAAFLGLAVLGLTTSDDVIVRAVYISAGYLARLVIVPLSLLTIGTGVFQSLATPWGLFNYYWVVIKFMLTVLAVGVLLLHTQPIETLAHAATTSAPTVIALRSLRTQIALDAAAGLLVLVVVTVLSVFKPQGITPLGRRKRQDA